MKVITLWQPWATFIMLGWKTIETRTHDRFKNLIGETIGIHAGNAFDRDWEELAGEYLSGHQLTTIKCNFDFFNEARGKIICTTKVEKTEWLYTRSSKRALINCDPKENGFYRFGLFLENIKKIKPIAAKGKQGIWNYDGEIVYL